MLRNIPEALSPELLKTIAEMGHGDTITIGDAYFPAASIAERGRLIRMDGVRATAVIDGILALMPLDVDYAEHPFIIMDLMDKDRGRIATPIWDEYISIVEKYEPKGRGAVGFAERFAFYDLARKSFAVVATGEQAVYGCAIMQKGIK